jgi:CHAT domain-containing protein
MAIKHNATATMKQEKEIEGGIAFADSSLSRKQADEGKRNKKITGTKGFSEISGELYVKQQAVREWPLDRLPETAEEAEIFNKQIGKWKIYKGLEATEENVWKANLGKAKYILFSTHGYLAKEDENVVEPALVLTLVNNPEGYDGLLGMTEAAGLRLNSDVVILSACSSAGESSTGGEGFAGMARNFLFAGSQAVVASHWKVDSRATKMLIENYGKYLKSKGRLEALEAARNVVKNAVVEYGKDRKIKVSYAHPYFWAAFVLLGER